MPVYVPTYYGDFRCKAGKCTHSCCIGWEIDVDEETFHKYKALDAPGGDKILKHIGGEAGNRCFLMGQDGRCPFLTRDNLCELILTLGEDALCQICADHPRFRNFFESRVEMGLGLSCEAACALILSQRERPRLLCLDEEGPLEEEETLFCALREEIFDLIFETETFLEGVNAIKERFSLPEVSADWTLLYESLEILCPPWKERLPRLRKPTAIEVPHMVKRQLLAYFIFRHLAGGLSDGRYRTRIAFALHATECILRLAKSEADFLEAARAYSEEIEYSDKNLSAVLDALEEKI